MNRVTKAVPRLSAKLARWEMEEVSAWLNANLQTKRANLALGKARIYIRIGPRLINEWTPCVTIADIDGNGEPRVLFRLFSMIRKMAPGYTIYADTIVYPRIYGALLKRGWFPVPGMPACLYCPPKSWVEWLDGQGSNLRRPD